MKIDLNKHYVCTRINLLKRSLNLSAVKDFSEVNS